MRLPPYTHAAGSAFGSPRSYSFLDIFRSGKDKSDSQTGDWSSLIGIVTAIIGNILISIALNTQRYAHIKLNEQYAERQRLLRRAQRRVERNEGGYGTQTSRPKERTRQDARNGHRNSAEAEINGGNGRYRDEEDDELSENEPLLASSIHSESSERRSDSEIDVEVPEDIAQKSYLKSPWWWAGIVLMTVGEAGNFLAYGFAPASIVSPLGVVALISNCIIAPFFLKERFRRRDFFGVVTAVAGAVTVVLSASDSNPKLGPDDIWRLISTWEFETYLGITIVVIIVLMWASSRYGNKAIFVDLGLVGLFGKILLQFDR
jgi:magnesium transporter